MRLRDEKSVDNHDKEDNGLYYPLLRREAAMGIQSFNIDGLLVFFESGERETAELISESVAKALHIIRESWGLEQPKNCRIHVMTSWSGFFFQAAPWFWKFLLVNAYPFWSFRARRMWPYCGAWTQRFGRRVAIGIKPPRLLETSDRSVGKLMFMEEKDTKIKLRHLTCHELTHACSAHLNLPAWLNEGLAAVTVDRFLGKQTIQPDTLELVREYQPKAKPLNYVELSHLSGRSLAYHAVRGYWIVQYLEEVSPCILMQLLSSRQAASRIEQDIPAILGMDRDGGFWNQIDERIADHLERKA